MNRPNSGIFAIVVFLVCVSASTAKAQYQLITINKATAVGTAVTPVSVTYPFGLAFDPTNGKLYTWDGTNINEINKATGAILNTIANFSTTDFEEGDLAFDSTGTGFLMALSSDDVCKFDLATSTFTSIGFQTDDINGLAFDAANKLWGISASSGKVYTIDTTTGVFTLVGASGIAGAYSGGLAFDAAGNLFAAMAPFGAPSDLYSINKATGVATKIGAGIGFSGIVGIRFEPATGTLFGLVTSGAPIPGVTVTESSGSTDVVEGGATDTYNVVLKTPPAFNVTITINPGPYVTVSPAVLTFTPANWNMAQTVTVTAVPSGIPGIHTGTITHAATSTDPTYNGIAVASVIVNITGRGGSSPGEGTYNGSSGVPAAVSNEGSYGFGAIGGGTPNKHHPPTHTVLLGPFFPHSGSERRLAPPPSGADNLPWYGAHLIVFNNSHIQIHPDAPTVSSRNAALGLLGWVALSALLGSAVGITLKKYFLPGVS